MFLRSFLGIVVHYISSVTLMRKYQLIACRRIKGTHDYENLATSINKILKEFSIEEKTISITTDNAANFVKAFRYIQTFII
jgi:coenzyme F420-reducing hydrogenase delta subunit